MRGQELLTDFSRGDFDEWIDNIVSATIEHCTRNLADIVKCIRTQTDTTIQLDASKKPVATPIKDATGKIIRHLIHPVHQLEWEHHQETYNQRKQQYEHNKLTVCNIIKASIDPYFLDSLKRQTNYGSQQHDLIWLFTNIKCLCHHDGKQDQEPSLDATPMQHAVLNRPAMLCHSTTSDIPLPDDFIDTSVDFTAHLLPSDASLYTNNQGAPHIDDDFASIDDDLDDEDASGNNPSESELLSNVEHDTSAHGENKGAAKKDMPRDGTKLDLESALFCEELVHRSNNVGNQGARDASKTQGADRAVAANGKNQGADEALANNGDQGFTTGNTGIPVEIAVESDDELKSQVMTNRLPYNIWMQNFLPAQGYHFKRNIFFIDTLSALIQEHDQHSSRGNTLGYPDANHFFLNNQTKPGKSDLCFCRTKTTMSVSLIKPLQTRV